MWTIRVCAAVVCVAAAAGCSSGASKARSSPSCEKVDGECLPTAKVSAVPVPAVTVGQPFRYQMPTSEGAASLELTVTSVKVKPATSSDPKGTVTVCVKGRLRNVGTVAYSADDTDAQMGAKWFGLDGRQADVNPGTIGACGGGQVWAGIDQPAPQPGRYVSGVWMYNVPSGPGALEVTDSAGHPLYRINYGPKSAQVPISAVGQ